MEPPGCGRLAGGLLGEAVAREVHEFPALVVGRQQVLDHLLLGVERLQVAQTHRLDSDLDKLALRQARRTLLLLEEVAAGLHEGALRNQTHDLGACDAQPAGSRRTAHLVESHVQRRDGDVRDVHRHLGDAVLLDEPADRLRRLQRAGLHDRLAVLVLEGLAHGRTALAHGTALLTHVERNGVGAARGGGVEVVVHGDQEVAGTDGRSARAGHTLVERAGTEVGRLLLARHAFGQRLIFALAADGQVAALRREGRSLVAVGRHAQLAGDALGQLAGQGGALFERDAGDGNQGQHVGGAHAGMRAVVVAHVDQLGSLAHAAERRLDHRFRLADEGHDRTVGRLARIDVEQFDALHGFDGRRDLADDVLVAALAEVGHAFNLS